MIRLQSCYVKEYPGKWEMDKAKSQFHILVLITKGTVTYWVNEDSVCLKAGDALFMPAGSIRGGFATQDHQRFATHFSVEEADRAHLPLFEERQFCRTAVSGLEYFKQRFLLLKHHWLMGGPYREAVCYGILLEMLGILCYDRDKWRLPAKKMDLASDMKNYMLEHYREPVKLQDLADVTGRTPNHISLLFKQVTGVSPIDYLHQVRINKAKELLFDIRMPIGKIAEETGYCDQAYFSRMFKKLTGVSPTAYLKGASE